MKKSVRFLQPLPISEKPWESTSMDFISGFPKMSEFMSVFVIVDQFSKYAMFVPAPKACPTEEAARLFFNNVVKYFRLLKDIVSDIDARFTRKFWIQAFGFETKNHLQTDG